MKTLKLIISTFFFLVIVAGYAQKIDFNGVTYFVKGNLIFVDKVDVTNTLSPEDQANIKNKLSEQLLAERRLKNAEKAQEKAEKAQKKAENKQKKAEKEIKKAESAKKSYENAIDKYEKEQKKHSKLSSKGKLSPEDEIKWQKKLEGLKDKIDKLKKKL